MISELVTERLTLVEQTLEELVIARALLTTTRAVAHVVDVAALREAGQVDFLKVERVAVRATAVVARHMVQTHFRLL